LSDEIPWYLRRTQNGWGWIAITLIVFHFFLPFLLLLSRNAKRSKLVLSGIALCVMFMSLVDLFWLIVPAFLPGQAMIHWSDIAAVAGIGGIWVYLYARAVKASPLFPVQDPNFVPYGEPS
jgi:cellulose synthase/poly-beta-1,6-N-acetylglucosamine synthase-like glycosyltransferase